MTAMEEPDWASVAQQEMLQVWGSLASLAKPSDAAEKTGQRARGGVAPGQVVQTSLQRYLRKGKAMGGLGRDKSKDQGQRALDEPTVHLLKTLTKLTLRLEEEMGRFRADTCFMLFVDTVTEQNTLQLLKEAAQVWQTAFEEGKVTTSLRIIPSWRPADEAQGGSAAGEHGRRSSEQVDDSGLANGGCDGPHPSLELLPLGSGHKAASQGRQAAPEPRQSPSVCRNPSTDAVRPCGSASVSGGTPPGDGHAGGGGSVQDGDQSARPGIRGCLHGSDGPLLLGRVQAPGLRLRPERMQKSPLALELEEAYLSTSFTDWTRRKPQGNRGSQWKKSQQQQQQQ